MHDFDHALRICANARGAVCNKACLGKALFTLLEYLASANATCFGLALRICVNAQDVERTKACLARLY